MVYDRVRDRLIVFGGRGEAGAFDDTWEFHLPSQTWQALATGAATRPPPRFSVVAGIDDEQQRLIIATGQGAGGIFFNDAWSFDLRLNTWTQITPIGTKPNVRYGSAGGTLLARMGDGRDVLLFGGYGTANTNDVWELDSAGVRISWTTDPGTLRYEVWRSDDPQFAANGPGLIRLPGEAAVQGPTASYVDQDPSPPAPIHFYQVRLAACAF